MRGFIRYLTRRDECGDSPIELAACMAVFMGCMAVLMSLPGH